jgi:hypothetical protein
VPYLPKEYPQAGTSELAVGREVEMARIPGLSEVLASCKHCKLDIIEFLDVEDNRKGYECDTLNYSSGYNCTWMQSNSSLT